MREDIDRLKGRRIHLLYVSRHEKKAAVIFGRLDIRAERGITLLIRNKCKRLLIRLDGILNGKNFFDIFS